MILAYYPIDHNRKKVTPTPAPTSDPPSPSSNFSLYNALDIMFL